MDVYPVIPENITFERRESYVFEAAFSPDGDLGVAAAFRVVDAAAPVRAR